MTNARTAPRQTRQRPEIIEPGQRSRLSKRRLLAAYIVAFALPMGVATASIPVRDNHGATVAVVLTASIVAIAALGAIGPAALAALTAAGAYDFLLTRPHYSLAVDDTDQAITALTLLLVGLVVGVLSSRTVHLRATATTRQAELTHLIEFAENTVQSRRPSDLAPLACQHITALLDLRECTWEPDVAPGPSEPILLPTGDVMGYLTELNPDRAVLPERLVLVAAAGPHRAGTFVLTTRGARRTSHEERRTAATIGLLFAAAHRRDRHMIS